MRLRSFLHFTLVIGLVTLTLGTAIPKAQAATPTATLSLTPSAPVALTNGTFGIDVKLSTGGQAASLTNLSIIMGGNISYNTFDPFGSVFNSTVNDPAINGNTLTFSRLRSDTGFNGQNGQVLHLVFNALSAGAGNLTIDQPNSGVLAFSDSSNILSAVNNSSITIKTPVLALGLLLEGRSTYTTNGDTIQVVTAGTNTQVAQITGITTASDGQISVTSSGFISLLSDTSTYDLRITVPGFLVRRINGLTNVLTQPISLTTNQALIAGDFDGNNIINIIDLVTGIRAYRNGTDTAALLSNSTFGGTTTLASLVTIIYNLNITPSGS